MYLRILLLKLSQKLPLIKEWEILIVNSIEYLPEALALQPSFSHFLTAGKWKSAQKITLWWSEQKDTAEIRFLTSQ